jgi:hypothetical protein
MARKTYDILSPDGFSISATETYTSKKQAIKAFDEWKKRYEIQGYYSSTKYGRIHLSELQNYCQLIEL